MLKNELPTEALWISDQEHAAEALQQAIANLDAIEQEIALAEQKMWQPHWRVDAPLDERLRRVGVTPATADMVVCLVRGWTAFANGEAFPDDTNALLDLHAESEESANRQLAAIVNDRAARA